MPANLPPEYFRVERLYKEASDPQEKAKYLEELISVIPKHKGTDKLRADFRSKLAKLKTAAMAAKKTAKHFSDFHIEKEGADARIVLCGASNTGKSSLLRKLTHAEPEVSDIPFTTWAPLPGTALFEEYHLQFVDTPPLDREYIEPELIDLLRTADLLVIVVDLLGNPIEQFQNALETLNRSRIFAPTQVVPELEKKPFIIPMLIAVNKDDNSEIDKDYETLDELLHEEWELIPVSAMEGLNINKLLKASVSVLKLIRVYSKMPGKPADMNKPFILKEGSTINDFAARVHKDFYEHLKFAKVWGTNVFSGQSVSRDHKLDDQDVVELHL